MGGVDNYGARRQEKSRPTQSDQDKVPNNTSLVLTAFQTACLAVIVMNATFIGNLLYHSLFNEYARKQSWQSLVFLILVVILNFLEIINNCASISKYFESFYNSILLLIDIITLAIFFWQIYILIEVQKSSTGITEISSIELGQNIIKIIIYSYLCIYISYVVWNYLIVKEIDKRSKTSHTNKEPDTRESILNSTIMRLMQIGFICTNLVLEFKSITIVFLNFILSVWILCTVLHNKTLNIFEEIIKSKK